MHGCIPDHVPAELVVDFDVWKVPPQFDHPFEYFKSVIAGGAPRIFYTPHNGGHWVLHRFADAMEGYRNDELFSSYPQGIPARQGEPERLIPVEIDPPDHQKYRSALAPLFTPLAVRRREPRIRQFMAELIEKVAGRGRCEFVEDIASKLPTTIFLEIMGMPISQLPQFLAWEHAFMRGADAAARKQGADSIFAYIVEFIASKQGHGGDDVASALLDARDAAGKPWSKAEIHNTAFLLYAAGLHTVAMMMSFIWHLLATHPDTRRQVAANYARTMAFVDELTRLCASANNGRTVRHDCVFQGVFMKAGDRLLNVPMLAQRDAEMFPDAEKIDLGRANARQQITFGAGIHRCLGAHLARTEMIIAIEEWFRRIPDFSLAPGARLGGYGTGSLGIMQLPLVWTKSP